MSTAIPSQGVEEGTEVTVDVSGAFSDPDGEALSYRATSDASSVAGVSVSGSNVTVTGEAPGAATITVTATDPGGLSATQTFEVTVNRANQAPTVSGSIPAQTVAVGETAVVDVSAYFTDADGDALSYAASSSNPSVAVVSTSGATVMITAVAKGSVTVTVTATDPGGLTATQVRKVRRLFFYTPFDPSSAKATQRRFGVARGVEKPNDGAATGHQAAPPREGGEPPPANAAGARGGAHPSPDRNVQHCVGWLPYAKRTRRPTLGTLGRQNLHTRTLTSPPYAVSTTGKKAISRGFQRRTGAGPGSASGRPICSGRARGEPRSRSVEVRAIRGSSSTAPAPDQEGVLLCARTHEKGSSWPSGSESFDTIQLGHRHNTIRSLDKTVSAAQDFR